MSDINKNGYEFHYAPEYFFWPMVFGNREESHFDITKCHDHGYHDINKWLNKNKEQIDVNNATDVGGIRHQTLGGLLDEQDNNGFHMDNNHNKFTIDISGRPPLERFMFLNQSRWLSFGVSTLLNFFLFFSLIPLTYGISFFLFLFCFGVFRYFPFSNQLHDYSVEPKVSGLLMVPAMIMLFVIELIMVTVMCQSIGVSPQDVMPGIYDFFNVNALMSIIL